MAKVLVTGGAGFIGSHLADTLLKRNVKVRVIDNLSSGTLDNLKKHLGRPDFDFIKGDLLKAHNLPEVAKDCDSIFHFAANPEVRISTTKPDVHFNQNVVATYNLLEALRKADRPSTILFASTSTVYGEASKIPTPEDYGPLLPISVYGASKLSCEALITSYAHLYGFRAIIFRLANIVGARSAHGVIFDFINKLRDNPRRLEILGDGTQTKSYLHVSDCIGAMLTALGTSTNQVEIFNVGSEDWLSVKDLARIVAEEMGLRNVDLAFTGGFGGRGWKGDVKDMLLDTSKIKSLGWNPKHNCKESVRIAARELLKGAP